MNKFIAAGFPLFFVLLIVSWPIFSQETQDKEALPEVPQLAIQEHEFNFGVVKEGARITHEFTVGNRGNVTLEIKKVQPG